MAIPQAQTKDRLDALISRGLHIPALPAQGAELLKLSRQSPETINLKQVVTLIESEPAMTAMVLRLANSSRYGTSRSIRRVDHALFIVGLEAVLEMLEFYLVRNMFPRWLSLPHFTVEEFWSHSWVCANTAQMLGQPRFLVQSLPGELYIAGLLHDIGKAVMAIHLPEETRQSFEQSQREDIPLYEAERLVMGVDHAQVGAALLDGWMLPNGILDAVGCHHDPAAAPPEQRELAALIQLADAVTICLQEDLAGEALRQRIQSTWLWSEGNSPLVREETFWPLLEEIRKHLTLKANETLDLDERPQTDSANAANHRKKLPDTTEVPTPPRRPRGFWRKLHSWWFTGLWQ